MFNKSIIINMDTYKKYVNARIEALQKENERLSSENYDLKLIVLRDKLDISKSKVFPKLFYK